MTDKAPNGWAKAALMDETTPTTVERDLTCWIKEGEFKRTLEELEVTSPCSVSDEYIGGLMRTELTMTIYQESGPYADSIQKALEDIFQTKKPYPLRYRPQGDGVGNPQHHFKALLTEAPLVIGIGDEAALIETTWKGARDYAFSLITA